MFRFIGREIRVRNYYEASGQPLAVHLSWLPHDGAAQDKVFDVSYESALRAAGYVVTVVPNQGKGAAASRIETVRRLLPTIWFDAESTEGGREALGWYHEKRDDVRRIGLGPAHDWASHGADAFGLMCVAYKEPRVPVMRIRRRDLRWVVWTLIPGTRCLIHDYAMRSPRELRKVSPELVPELPLCPAARDVVPAGARDDGWRRRCLTTLSD